MTKNALLGVGLLLFATMATGCAVESEDQEEPSASSEDKFTQLRGTTSIIEPAMRGSLRIRIQHDAPLTNSWGLWTRMAVGRWFSPLRGLPGGGNLPWDVRFVDRDEDLTLIVHAGMGRAFYSPVESQRQQRIEVYEDDGRGFTVLLHEFGHAMGLGDSYWFEKGGCLADQPASVMCNAATETLRADDIRGARFEYCQRTRNCSADLFKDEYGGGGGELFRSTCPPRQRLVGLEVHSGLLVDAVYPLCEDVRTGYRTYMARIGGGGGGNVSKLNCRQGTYVRSLHVNAGDFVDSVQLECSDGAVTPRVGGGGGSPATYTCPSGFPAAVGLRGGAGTLVDRLGLSCDTSTGPTYIATMSPPPR